MCGRFVLNENPVKLAEHFDLSGDLALSPSWKNEPMGSDTVLQSNVCHAWRLMDNHCHIAVETVEGNLAQGMRHLNGVYTQTFNRTHHRVGHVFQGHYKAIIVEKDSYSLELARYVVLNPVRARMVKAAAAWQWSSYPAMVGTQAAQD